MAHSQLDNYLVGHRMRTGLSQADVASMVNAPDNAAISRYEAGNRLPPLQIALGLEVLFGVPVAVLFAGTRMRVAQRVERRIVLHHRQILIKGSTLKGRERPAVRAKLEWHEARRVVRSHAAG